MKKLYKVLKPVYVGPPGNGEVVTDGLVQLNDATGQTLIKKGVVEEQKPKRRSYKRKTSVQDGADKSQSEEIKGDDNG